MPLHQIKQLSNLIARLKKRHRSVPATTARPSFSKQRFPTPLIRRGHLSLTLNPPYNAANLSLLVRFSTRYSAPRHSPYEYGSALRGCELRVYWADGLSLILFPYVYSPGSKMFAVARNTKIHSFVLLTLIGSLSFVFLGVVLALPTRVSLRQEAMVESWILNF